MTEAVLTLEYATNLIQAAEPIEVKLVSVFMGAQTMNPGSGITQGQADARYILKSAINAANGVAGLDANVFLAENELPLPPVTLTVLFTNQMT